MDRAISDDAIKKQKQKRYIYITAALLGLIIIVWFFRGLIAPSLSRERIMVAKVQRGNFESTINATGKVVPGVEQVITAPFRADLKQILKTVGATVEPGEAILNLNTDFAALNLEKLKDELQLKEAQYQKQRLTLEKQIYDLKVNKKVQELKIQSLKAAKENMVKLHEVGGGTAEEIEQATMDLEVGEIELQQINNTILSMGKSMEAQLRELELSMNMQQKSIREQEQKLDAANARSQLKGVVTWQVEQIGATLQEGEEIAKVADLTSYKIKGSIVDDYATKLEIGMPVRVKANKDMLEGKVSDIQPSAVNGIVTFYVSLATKTHQELRPQMAVDLYLVTASKKDVLFVQNEGAFTGRKKQEVFTLEGSVANRRNVSVGLSNFEQVEITAGLVEGDEIIITNMNTYRHLPSLKIKD
ncbi:efflux RND transporter periplasmic adaptor subunit [Xanthovirga aplysinae]|uniref:efflux RND transporter periplasmic adaptor subunit n=1 Tax=Xanthovirga aplysinae TaxID=2529853 RepID=UPI0012BD54CE|nr:HlyD family efflux transporter periplasmic adaptor subunit [Xanthovirga aplysinae]MTI33250.1 HlyD family efflux transporter periplasmic adaptor subunit [Xanthovirga aplysinae]